MSLFWLPPLFKMAAELLRHSSSMVPFLVSIATCIIIFASLTSFDLLPSFDWLQTNITNSRSFRIDVARINEFDYFNVAWTAVSPGFVHLEPTQFARVVHDGNGWVIDCQSNAVLTETTVCPVVLGNWLTHSTDCYFNHDQNRDGCDHRKGDYCTILF